MIQSRWPASNNSSGGNSSNYRDLLQEATVQIRRLRNQLDQVEQRQVEPIAIVGMACRFPGGANTPEAYWELLRNGIDTVGEIPLQRWDTDTYYDPDPTVPGKMYTRAGSFVDAVDQFDPQFFGISPREAKSLDPQQRLLLEVSYNALENAGIPAFDQQGSATGVFVGLSFDDYAQRSVRSGNLDQIDAFSSLGNTRSIAAGRIAYIFGFQGPTMQLDTTCSSSLLAVHLACQSLRGGECNLALAGGINLMLSPEATIGFCKLQALSPDGRCKTFDAAADGYGRGEGCGVVVLKRLGDAIANQDNILALIKGSAVNHDGVSNGLTAPNGSAQTAVIRQALLNARLEPRQIQYVEAHGTGTSLGDPIELISLNQALESRFEPLLVGSVKTNLGHLEAAAGVAGLMKVILSLQHQEIPPHLHLDTPNPYIPWERLAIQVPTTLMDWPKTAEPRRAGLSGFGMSGTNAHIILEEAPPSENKSLGESLPLESQRPLHILTLSARNETALQVLAQQYQTWLTKTEHPLANICFTANTGRSHFNHRLAICAADTAQMSQRLGHVAQLSKDSQQALPLSNKKIVFLFTGQGSQYRGMGQELYQVEPVFYDAINHCAKILSELGVSLLEILYPGSAVNSQLSIHDTFYTQPALFAIEYALAKLWQSWGIEPDYVLGHSVGEYVAACIADVFSLEDGLKLITARGRLMQSLPAGGGMAAVMASQEQVAGLLGGVEIAAVNGPQNTVISGELAALDSVVATLEAQGFKVKRLNVSHAFHSALMEPMLADFKQVAQTVSYSPPSLDIISSVTGQSVATEMSKSGYWVNQARRPVQFAPAMSTAAKEGCNIFIEIGPRPTLVSMGQLCAPELEALWLPSLSPGKERDSVSPDWQTLTSSLGTLYEAGCTIDWASFDKAYPRQTVLLPNYPFQRKRYWLEPARSSPSIQFTESQYPLLGKQLSLAGDTARYYETHLLWDAPLVWADHRVFQAVLFPAAGYLEMALAAGRDIFQESGYEVTNVSFAKGLWLNEGTPACLQTVVTQQTDSYRFEIHSRQEQEWSGHSSGSLELSSARLTRPNLKVPDIQIRLTKTLSREQFYQRYAAQGISYGASFQAVQQVWLGNGEALAQVKLAESIPLSFQMHPILLDAGLQLAGATLEETSSKSYLPVAVERFSYHRQQDAAWVHAQRRSAEPQPVIDITWTDAEHRVVAVLTGLRLQAVESSQSPTQWLHQVVWQHQQRPQVPGEFLRAPDEVRDAIAPQFTQLIQQPDFLTYQRLQPELNSLAVAYIVQAFSQLGWTPQQGKSFSSAALAQILEITAKHHNLFERCLALLHEANILTQTNGQWQVTGALLPSSAQELEPQLQQQPLLEVEMTLLQRCGVNLATVFQGETDPLALLFPQGDLTALSQLYRSSVGASVMNQLLQAALIQAIAHAPHQRSLRILEIGAGTGGTTAKLLPLLADLDQAISYVFTDISPRFTTAAQENFGQFQFVDYALLDIETSPAEQGFDANFDVVIAANVLHATADIHKTLGHFSKLLAPGGQLILLEGTVPVGWIDLIFGLTPGWWKFTDRDLRPNHPLLAVEQWQAVLQANGFSAVTALKPDNGIKLAQSVIIAQTNSVRAKRWLVTGDISTAHIISDLLTTKGQLAETADYGDLNLDQSSDFNSLVYVLPKTARETLVLTSNNICRELLSLVQRLTPLSHPPQIYLVSADNSPESQLAYAPLWGMVQTLQLEHPELRCARIQADTDDTLVKELLTESPEAQIISTKQSRQVARLAPYSSVNIPTQLVSTQPGTLTGLSWQPMAAHQPGADDVLIRVQATGLNFRDVLIAMDQYPETAPLGCECVGTIAAMGANVSTLKQGQAVMAIAGESFAQTVIVHQDLVTPIPEKITSSEAATLPVAFTTAYYSLCHLANLQPGERVLIHAATGGVGQAAVQIAQQIGAEIFATASPSKWNVLRDYGVAHIMNSRTLDFAGTIMSATGGIGVDVVLNSLPGEFRTSSVAVLAAKGRFVEIGKGNGLTPEKITQLRTDIKHFTVDLAALCPQEPKLVHSMLGHVKDQVDKGIWSPLSVTEFTRDEVIQAFRTIQQAKHTGKVVVTQPQDTGVLPAIQFQADATYLITGGLGGLGLTMAQWMIDHGAMHIALLSRRRPTDKTQTAIRTWESQGVTVSVLAVDVTDHNALENALAEITEHVCFPAGLKGIIHAAGVLDDGLMQQITWPQFEQVLAPKVAGAWHLHRLTQEIALDFFVLFSSAAALLGSPGQANHAAANSFLDGLAHYRQQLGLPGLSINWGAWSDVGSALKYQQQGSLKHLLGVDVITPEQGLAKLEQIWHTPASQVGIVPIDWSEFLSQSLVTNFSLFENLRENLVLQGAQTSTQGTAKLFLEQLRDTPPGKQRQYLETFVCQQVCQTLGFQLEELDQQAGFFDLGMDSLTALELKNNLQTNLGISLPNTLVFDYPTVAALLEYLTVQLLEAGAETSAVTTDHDPAGISGETELPSGDQLAELMDQRLDDIESLLGEDGAS
ncbi:MAG: SDR family NAD(P)-dependent oxidoreductase [Cyanobacteria bacterium P01_B01_bin.77]